MNVSVAGKVCGILGILCCVWFWLFWFLGPHMHANPVMQLGPALGGDMIAIPLLAIAGRYWSRWFYIAALVALGTYLFVGLRIH